MTSQVDRLYRQDFMPRKHKEYLKKIQDVNPSVIYDVGSCVLHWARPARKVWPNARIICFDAVEEVRHLHEDYEYFCYVLSDKDGEEKIFYKNLDHMPGQSLYKENSAFSQHANFIFGKSSEIRVKTFTLDTVVKKHNLPLPDLMKIDVQGSELDILKGSTKTISKCENIIVELQEVDYNIGAPKASAVMEYMNSIGYDCVAEKFSSNRYDADYHFRKSL